MFLLFKFNSFWPTGSDTILGHRSGSTLAQVVACGLTVPSHYLIQCWFIINEVLCQTIRLVSQEVLKISIRKMILKNTFVKLLHNSQGPMATELIWDFFFQQWLTFARQWWIYDARWQCPFKTAPVICHYLQGKHKPIYHPNSKYIEHNIWLTMNKDFLVTSEAIPQWFSLVTQSGVKHYWWIASPVTRKSLFTVSHALFYFSHVIQC